MRTAALMVAKIAPQDTNIAVWCRYDGTFTFAMRAYASRPDLGVVLLGKVLFRNVAVSFARGYTQQHLDAQAIVKKLESLHVQYVVFQSGYLRNVREIQQLHDALNSSEFAKTATIPMHANYPFSPITKIYIYRLNVHVPPGRVNPRIQIELLGGKTL